MAKARKKKEPILQQYIYVHFAVVPEEDLDIQFSLEDLLEDAGEVRGSRENDQGEFDPEGEGWAYEMTIHDPTQVEKWFDRVVSEIPQILKDYGEVQKPWLEIVAVGEDEQKQVVRKKDLRS